ncbi:MAG TPA: hypothetical protein PK156_27520 [Polyangium sp.]|nr:hypothetical protein [Polyangium sp.]
MVSGEYAKDIVSQALLDAQTPTKPRPPAEDEKRMKAWLWTLMKFRARGVWRIQQKQNIEISWDDKANTWAITEPPV